MSLPRSRSRAVLYQRPSVTWPDLESKPQPEAEDPLTTHRGVFSEATAIAAAVRIAPLRSVGEVEPFSAKLKAELLGYSELPEEAEIPLEPGRAAQGVPAHGAEAHPIVHIRIGTDGSEGVNIEKLLPRPVVSENGHTRLDLVSGLAVAWGVQCVS